ncbi:histidine kinase [Pontibacter silvestris]|uniref:Histidine kinase n=1 Tax=Pontibacter silvestris TaxID=2305183 RepID=A0ABW4X0N8_9BACT|nr:histidine kinase [Pontibacter silvestris]MCC9136048.1 histidine kinase [Pontibacter silvestris]
MNLAQVDFQQIRIKHILFKSKVRSVLYGGNYDAAFFSRTGPIGLWFDTIGFVRYEHEPEMKELAKVQRELNSLALQLFDLYKGGNIEEAHEGLKTLDKKSELFLNLLTKLDLKLAD